MIVPERAPVRPRVTSISRSDSFLLEDEILRLLEAGAYGAIQLTGAAGSGKTTALQHLAAAAATHSRLVLIDNSDYRTVLQTFEKSPYSLVVSATSAPIDVGWIDTFWMAPWCRDELIEYLLAKDKQACASVMARFSSDDLELVRGCPELCVLILDELRSRPDLSDGRNAFCRGLEESLQDIQHCRTICAHVTLQSAEPASVLSEWLIDEKDARWIRHSPIRALLVAQYVAADLHSENAPGYLKTHWKRNLVDDVAKLIKGDTKTLEFLQTLILRDKKFQPMCASLLHAAGANWIPPAKRDVFRKFEAFLEGAYLEGVCWDRAVLQNPQLSRVDLSAANLEQARFERCIAVAANFQNANLKNAVLTSAQLAKSDLSGAIFCSVNARDCIFENTNLEGARFDEADLVGSSFERANLTNCSFRGANLTKSNLTHATFDDVDFRFAILDGADLTKLDLRTADLGGAVLRNTYLVQCDLQNMHLDGIDFRNAILEGADLTGASLAGANLTRANLRMTGLADVNMEGACLQQANLHGATFHMGSSRSGLLFSPLASEGTRTGFYTDEFDEQTYKAPEEIRKANLRGADLRGARVDTVDFYLVDLRDALYDAVQEKHFRRCGAILEDLCKR